MSNYHLIKIQYKYYKSLKRIYSPALRNYIFFTGKGFNHLLYKQDKTPRLTSEQKLKLLLLNSVKHIISTVKNIYQIRKYPSGIIHYSIANEINGNMIVVVVEKGMNSKLIFLSVLISSIKKASIRML